MSRDVDQGGMRVTVHVHPWPAAREQLYPARAVRSSRGSNSIHIRPGGETLEPYHTLCYFTAPPRSHNTCGKHRWRGIWGARLFLDNQPQNNDNLRSWKTALPARFGPSVISELVLAQSNQPFLNIKRINRCTDTLLSFSISLSLSLFSKNKNTWMVCFSEGNLYYCTTWGYYCILITVHCVNALHEIRWISKVRIYNTCKQLAFEWCR